MTAEYSELEEKKNYFFRDSYRRLLNLLVLLLWVAVALSTTLAFLMITPGTPKYYASSTMGEIYDLHALSEPVVTDDFVLKWASMLATSVYNLNFNSYESQLEASRPKFTENGWQAMQQSLNSGLIASIKANKLIVSSVVNGAPVISMRAVIHHRYTWVVEFPLLLTYQSASQVKKQTLHVQVRVMRVPVLDVPHGIQCDGFMSMVPQ